MEMSPERWQRIERLFELVADLPVGNQRSRLEGECADDPSLVAEVWRLLEHDRSGAGHIAQVLEQLAQVDAVPEPVVLGRHLGPYRLVRELGRGGMGVVFEALRDDDQFHKRVAIKVASRAAFAPEFLRRFRDERQILAGLEHPHIARLLDGGATDEGVPFFAMEYVEGEPIHRYAADRRLPVRARLDLFLQVCDAVEYAHQNLVVHCDLKPGNILVAAGQVRLLDFGIAKLVSAADGGRTLTGAAPLTPDYCSPEQVRGQAVTTRTDVYSLGLVLYELLTGERGQVADTRSPVALDRSVCDTAIVAPSARVGDRSLARQLGGDLDTIVLTATQKDPARRYPSVAALAEDLRRHLDSRPILARRESAWYRASRFGRRHWMPLTAAALILVTLVSGVVAATYQARRAERRFQQVRSIASALMGEVHGAIRDLPASTAAQEVVVRTAVDYLDNLAQDAAGDNALQIEIAQGYMKVAQIAYSVSLPSLNRSDEARRALEKAGAIVTALENSRPDDAAVAAASTALDARRGQFLFETGEPAAALSAFQRGIAHGESGLARHPDELALLESLLDAYNGIVARFNGTPEIGPHVARYVEVAERIAALRPETPESVAELGVAYSQAANHAAEIEDVELAEQLYRRNIELQTRAIQRDPNNATVRRNLMIAWTNVADLALGPLGTGSYTGSGGPPVELAPDRRVRAREAFARALEQAEWRYERDPDNDSVTFDYAICVGRHAPAFPPGDAGAVAALDKSLALLGPLEARHPARTRAFLVEFRGSLAERLRQSGQLDRALREWASIDDIVQRAVAADAKDYYTRRQAIPVLENWAQTLAAGGDRRGALRVARRAVQLADEVALHEALYARAPGWPPRVRDWLAELHESLGDRAAAESVQRESAEQWARVAARSDLPPDLMREARQRAGARP